MFVQGSDCSIVIKTASREFGVPYAEETIREAISIIKEEASIEGDSLCRGLPQSNGVTGCIVTPLDIETAPLLLHLAMGSASSPVFVSETRNLYHHSLSLLPYEDGPRFDLVQKRGNGKWLYERCGVTGFELRVMRDETIKLKLDISGENAPVNYPYTAKGQTSEMAKYQTKMSTQSQTSEMSGPVRGSERFHGDKVTYQINGREYKTIYGVTILSKKEDGIRTEIWIKRALEYEDEIPHLIDELSITAQLYRESYEYRNFGTFRISFRNVVLNSDETVIDSADAVIGPIWYHVAGITTTDVFTTGDEVIQ